MNRRARLVLDVVVNVGFAVVKAAALFWVIRMAGVVLTPVALGILLLARRFSSAASNLLQLGASQTLLRQLPIHRDDLVERRAYLTGAVGLWLLVVAIATPIGVLGADRFGALVFPGAGAASDLWLWTLALTLATVLYFIAGSVLVADRTMVRANLFDLLCTSGFLFAVLWIVGAMSTPQSLLAVQAIGTLALSAMVIVFRLHGGPVFGDPIRAALRMFRSYGLSRAVVTCLDAGLLLAGPWLLRADLAAAGFFSVALVPVQVLVVAIAPVAQLASVVAARLTGQDDDRRIALGVRMVAAVLLYGTLVGLSVVIPWADYLLGLWLPDPVVAAGVARDFGVLRWGILPLVVFSGLKSVIEVRWTRPRNLYSLVASYAVLLLVFFVARRSVSPSVAAGMAIVSAFAVAAVFTLAWLWRYLRGATGWGVVRLVLIVAVLGAGNAMAAASPSRARLFLTVSASMLLAFFTLAVLKPAPIIQSVRDLVRPPAREP